MDQLPISLLSDYLFCPRRAGLKLLEALRGRLGRGVSSGQDSDLQSLGSLLPYCHEWSDRDPD